MRHPRGSLLVPQASATGPGEGLGAGERMTVTEKTGEGQRSRAAQEAAGERSLSEPCTVVPLRLPQPTATGAVRDDRAPNSPPVCSCQLLSGTPSFNPSGSGEVEAQSGSVTCWSHTAGGRAGSRLGRAPFRLSSCRQPLPGMQWVFWGSLILPGGLFSRFSRPL